MTFPFFDLLLHGGTRPCRARRSPRLPRSSLRYAPRVVPLEERALLSTLTVTSDADSGKGTLRAEIAAASSGDTINFAPSAYGTITLTSGPLVVPDINLTIKGPGADRLTISGNGTYAVLVLGLVPSGSQTPATMTISGLTIASGNASGGDEGDNGGGIEEAVNLTVSDSVFQNNQAPSGAGGAISNSSGSDSGLDLTIQSDLFKNNTSSSTNSFFRGQGGAIDAENGSNVSVSSSTFIDNQSIAAGAEGGAISVTDNTFQFPNVYGSLSVTGSTFSGNVASSNSAYGCCEGWSAGGGAIWTDPQVALTVGSSQFIHKKAELEVNSSGAQSVVSGGAIAVNPGTYAFPTPPPSETTITNSLFSGNIAVGTGNSLTMAQGGAINAGGADGTAGGGTVTISGSTFNANQALGDSSNINPAVVSGGPAQGGRHQHLPGCPGPHF